MTVIIVDIRVISLQYPLLRLSLFHDYSICLLTEWPCLRLESLDLEMLLINDRRVSRMFTWTECLPDLAVPSTSISSWSSSCRSSCSSNIRLFHVPYIRYLLTYLSVVITCLNVRCQDAIGVWFLAAACLACLGRWGCKYCRKVHGVHYVLYIVMCHHFLVLTPQAAAAQLVC